MLIRLVYTEIQPFENVKIYKEMYGNPDTASGCHTFLSTGKNKEKDTTDHEGSEEITQEEQYSQRYVYHLFLSQFSSEFLVCYIAILQP